MEPDYWGGAGRPCWIIEGASGSPGSYSTEEELGSCILGYLMQLDFPTKAKLSYPLSLQLVCNQGNHFVVKTTTLFLQ